MNESILETFRTTWGNHTAWKLPLPVMLGLHRFVSYVDLENPGNIYSIAKVFPGGHYVLVREVSGTIEPVVSAENLSQVWNLGLAVMYAAHSDASFYEVPYFSQYTLDMRRVRPYYGLKCTLNGQFLSSHGKFNELALHAWVSSNRVYLTDLAGRLRDPDKYQVERIDFREYSEVPPVELVTTSTILPLESLVEPWEPAAAPP